MTLPSDVTLSDESTTPRELGRPGAMLMAEYLDAQAARSAAEERMEKARAALELLVGDAHGATVDGQPVLSWKPVVSKRFDQRTAQRFLTPEQAAACYVETLSRRFVPAKADQ